MSQKSPTIIDSYEARLSPLSWFLILICPLMWSVNYLVARAAPPLITPHVLATGRWLLAALILLCFCWRELYDKRHLILREWWHFLVLGTLGMWVCGAWLYVGGRTAPATNIALIYALSPMFIVIGAAWMLHERLRFKQMIGVVLAMLGLLHVVLRGGWLRLGEITFIAGDAIVLSCAVAWAAYSLLLKRWPSNFSPMARLVAIAFGGALLMLPWAVLELSADFLGMSGAWETTWNWQSVGLIVAAGIFPGAGAYAIYALLQRRIGASRTASVLYLGPLYAALTAYAVLGEPLHLYHAMGGAVILLGIYLTQ